MSDVRNKIAADIIRKRIRELEEIQILIDEGKLRNEWFAKHVTRTLRLNQELYAYLVNFSGDNLIH